MRIICIDPGIANTGLVYMDERSVLAAKTVRTAQPKGAGLDALHSRLRTIEAAMVAWMADKPHEAVVIEDFVHYGTRNNCFTYKTPYTCGYLDKVLDGENVIWQDAPTVLSHRSKKSPLRSKTRAGAQALAVALVRGYGGGHMIADAPKTTAEHLYSAFVHGIYYLREVGAL